MQGRVRGLNRYMNGRKHHNTKGFRQCKNGKCERDLKHIAKRLGLEYQSTITKGGINDEESNESV
jgi:hypothetical protein